MNLTDAQIASLSGLIGAPYDRENRAPGYHCWGAFCAAQSILGRDGLPHFVPETMAAEAKASALTSHQERRSWREIAQPETGCAVLMGRARLPIHIGCYLELDGGGVLHGLPGSGVCFDGPQALKLKNWTCITYLQHI